MTMNDVPGGLPLYLSMRMGSFPTEVRDSSMNKVARVFFYSTVTCSKKPSPWGEGGSAYAESDEGLTYPKDHLNKECKALP